MDKMDKVQALESALKQIERDFGKGSIMKLGDALGHAFYASRKDRNE